MADGMQLEKTGSEPDLHKMHAEGDNINLLRRKRKAMDHDYTELHQLFNKFSSDLTSKLSSMKTDLESQITNIQSDINTVIKNDLNKIKADLVVIESNQSQLFTDMGSVKEAIEFQDGIQKDLTKKVSDISSASSTYGSDIGRLQEQVRSLQSDLNDQQQRDRATNLELSGIPEKSNEKLSDYFINITKFLELQSSTSDIIHITRIRPMSPVPGRPKAIVVKLVSRSLRDSILSAVRARRGINTSDIGIPGDRKQIFINEHLTPYNKLLHKNIKEKAAAAKYQFVWVRDGKLFTRKNDTSSTIRIRNNSDLNKIV